MKKILHIVLSGIITIVALATAPTSHVSAMQTHSSFQHSTAQHCSVLCNSAGVKKADDSDIVDLKDDDEPVPPYYLQFQSSQMGMYVDKVIRSHEKEDEPTNIPIYRLCCVVRL